MTRRECCLLHMLPLGLAPDQGTKPTTQAHPHSQRLSYRDERSVDAKCFVRLDGYAVVHDARRQSAGDGCQR